MGASLVLATILRCEGKNRLSMMGIGLGGVLNMALDPLLIFGFRMGITGAALATFISQVIGFCLLLYFFLSGRSESRLRLGMVSCGNGRLSGLLKMGFPSLCRHGIGMVSAADGTHVEAIRDIRFTNIHATGLELPLMYGRPGCPLERFTFSNCSFRRVAEETLPENWKRHGYSVNDRQPEKEFVTRHAVGFVFDNTVFDVP